MKIVLVDKNILPSQELAEKIIKAGGNAMALQVDLSKPKDRGQIISRTIQRYGRIDYLINNAGYVYADKVEHLDLESAHDLFEVNFWAYLDMAQRVIPVMKEQKQGTIINIASLSSFGVVRQNSIGIYSASKYALLAIFATMAIELKDCNINLKIVCPSFMNTNLFKNAIGPEAETLQKHVENLVFGFDSPDLIAQEIFDKIYQKDLIIWPGSATPPHSTQPSTVSYNTH